VDDYFWMRDRDQGHCYLESENAYTSTMMQHTEALQSYSIRNARSHQKPTSVPSVKMTTTTIHAQKEKLTQFTVANKAVSTPQRYY